MENRTRRATPVQTQVSNDANHAALQRVRALVIATGEETVAKRFEPGQDAAEPGKSEALPLDPFTALQEQGKVIEPPFDLLTLAMLPEHSSEMGQCVEAMEVNIEGFGHRQIPRIQLDDPETDVPKELRKAVTAERVWLANFFEYATEESFVEFRMKLRRDLESTGNAYIEVIRDARGKIQSFSHIPSYQIRLGRLSDEQVKIERPILRLQEDGSVTVETIPEYRRFRNFVQSKHTHRRNLYVVGTKKRWFKSFLDPRPVSMETGDVEAGLAVEKQANELIHLRIYSSRSPYGIPRYIGNLLSIFGDRAAEEINYVTFRNNNVPSMVIAVSNGILTEGTIQRIQDFVDSHIQGSDNRSKFLILEGETLSEDGEDGGQVKIDIKPLTEAQHNDALFQQYSKNNQDKIRRAWRLPPIFVGRSDDYTRATAESSRRLADEQVIAPQRDSFDALINRTLYPAMGVRYHKYKSNSPNTTDNEQLVRILQGAEKTGGMTPRIARTMLMDILSTELPEFPAGFPADVPFSLSMAEAVKNMAQPNEPGQQVTALKAMLTKALGGTEDQEDPVVAYFMDLYKRVDSAWQQSAREPVEGELTTGE